MDQKIEPLKGVVLRILNQINLKLKNAQSYVDATGGNLTVAVAEAGEDGAKAQAAGKHFAKKAEAWSKVKEKKDRKLKRQVSKARKRDYKERCAEEEAEKRKQEEQEWKELGKELLKAKKAKKSNGKDNDFDDDDELDAQIMAM